MGRGAWSEHVDGNLEEVTIPQFAWIGNQTRLRPANRNSYLESASI